MQSRTSQRELTINPVPTPGATLYRLSQQVPTERKDTTWSALATGGLDVETVQVVSDKWHREPFLQSVAANLSRRREAVQVEVKQK